MATTKLDTAYSEFIVSVIPLCDQMNKDELIDLLADITKKLYSMIDGKEETQRDFMDEMKSDMEEEKDVYDDDTGEIVSL